MSRPVSQVLEAAARANKFAYRQHASLDELESGWKDRSSIPECYMDFIPIRLVTLLEAEVRSVISEAINAKDIFTVNSIKLIDKWSSRQVLDAMLALNRERISIGELAAHSITIGSYVDLIAYLEKVFGEGVAQELEEATECWIETQDEEQKRIIEDFALTRDCIKRLFFIRHILVHENPETSPYDPAELPSFIEHTKQFIEALGWFGTKRVHGPVPQTQAMMNSVAHHAANAASKTLCELRGMSREEAAKQETRLQRIEAAWDQFVVLSAEEEAAVVEGGSMAPMIWSDTCASLNAWRVDRLRKEAQRLVNLK